MSIEGKEGSYRAAESSWKNQTILSVFGENSSYSSWVNQVWDVAERSSRSLFFCCLQCSTFCHSPFHLDYFLHPHMLTKPSFSSIFNAWLPKFLLPSPTAMDPSPQYLPDLVIKVNYEWIEGKSVSLGLYRSSLKSHIFKAENLHRQTASTKVPLGWRSIFYSFLAI